MQASDATEFTRLMQKVSEFYGKSMSKPLVEMYWEALKGCDLAAVKEALNRHALHPDAGKFMPRPSDVLSALQGDSQTQALLAWSKVAKAIREIGRYSSVVFDDTIIHAVIRDMGGWVSLCDVVVKELPFREKDFVARYAGYVGHPPAEYPKVLTGLLEHHNRLAGHKTELPLCIGDPQKALAVYAQGQIPGRAYCSLPASESATTHPPVLSNPSEENVS